MMFKGREVVFRPSTFRHGKVYAFDGANHALDSQLQWRDIDFLRDMRYWESEEAAVEELNSSPVRIGAGRQPDSGEFPPRRSPSTFNVGIPSGTIAAIPDGGSERQ